MISVEGGIVLSSVVVFGTYLVLNNLVIIIKELQMKKLLLSLMICLSMGYNLSANETIELSIGDWAPYTSPTDPKGKVAETIIAEAFQLEGIDIKNSYHGWKDAFAMAQDAKTDGTYPWFQSEEREKNFFYSKKAIIRTKTVFFHLKSMNFNWENIDNLKKYKVGGVTGFKSSKFLKDKGVNVMLSENDHGSFKKLLAGDIDIAASSYFVGHYAIKNNFTPNEASKFTSHKKKIFPATGAYLLVSKKHPRGQELVDKFDSGLQKLVKSGRYVQIIKESIKK